MVLVANSFQQPFYGTKDVTLGWGFRVGDSNDADFVSKFADPDLRHRGVDYGVSLYESVLSVANGEVVEVEQVKASNVNSGFGTYVVVKHTIEDEEGNQEVVYSLYAHLFSVEVKKGDIVEAGDLLGSLGNTGTSTGPHLHFEISSSPDVSEYSGYDIPGDADGGFIKNNPEDPNSTNLFKEGNSFDPVQFISDNNQTSVVVAKPEDDIEGILDLTAKQNISGEVQFSGELEIYGDTDAVKVSLEGGVTYRISVTGYDGDGEKALGNSFFTLRYKTFDNKVFASPDTGKDEVVLFTPEKSGDYFINIGGGGSTVPNPLKPDDYFGVQYGSYMLTLDNVKAPPETSLPETVPDLVQGPQRFSSNSSFETGSLAGWEVLGAARAVESFDADGSSGPTGDGLATATDGEFFALLESSGDASAAEIEDFLGLSSGSLAGISDGTPTTGTAIKVQVDLVRAAAFDFDFYFDAGDYSPFNDFAFMVINGEAVAFGDVSDVGDYGDSGWLDSSWFEAGTTDLGRGSHEIGFGVLDVGDEILSSALYLDDFVLV